MRPAAPAGAAVAAAVEEVVGVCMVDACAGREEAPPLLLEDATPLVRWAVFSYARKESASRWRSSRSLPSQSSYLPALLRLLRLLRAQESRFPLLPGSASVRDRFVREPPRGADEARWVLLPGRLPWAPNGFDGAPLVPVYNPRHS